MVPLTRQKVTPVADDRVAVFPGSPAKRRPMILTPRETEIVRLVVRGMTNKEIAQTLEISHWTVATHLRRIYDKTHVKRRAALSGVLMISQA